MKKLSVMIRVIVILILAIFIVPVAWVQEKVTRKDVVWFTHWLEYLSKKLPK